MTSSPQGLDGMELSELLPTLATTSDGLTGAEAAKRLAENGPNAVEEKKKHPLLEFAGYFWAPIPWLIEAALVLTLVLQHWPDAVVIGVLLLMNGLVAFYEERQAADTIAALKKNLATTAHVRRDGGWVDVPVRELVVGDVVHVALGDIVPADARLLDGEGIAVDQSALTGESLPVTRAVGGQVYSGSVVSRGQANAVVYAVGAASFFGRTTALVQGAGTVSHFQHAVLQIGKYLIYGALILVALITAASMLRGEPWANTVEFALVVIIASVPVAMPAVLSVTMAVGARNLAKQKAVVSHLPAVEELGGIDILCSDKTGTLTQNSIRVGEPWLAPGVESAELLLAAALASSAASTDAIDVAVRAALPDAGALDGLTIEKFTPFDPTSKRTESLVGGSTGASIRYSKGAPQVIAELCTAAPAAVVKDFGAVVDDFATRGDRALGVAIAAEGQPWRLLGLLPLADPPREDSASTIAAARELGVDVKMITGDALAIGRQIASEVGLGQNLLEAGALDALPAPDESKKDSAQSRERMKGIAELVEGADGFAQVFPQHKYLIVEALQSRGHIVGMTGDGVNDAPALKQADAGIAVSQATDAARAAADVVLLEPGLSVIVNAIRLAREMFGRMTSYTIYRIAETIRVLLLVTIAGVAFNFRPVTAIMIVILALLNDGALLSIAYDRAHGSPRPVKWNMRSVITVASSLGVMGVIETFLLLLVVVSVFRLDMARDLGVIQTMVFLKLCVSGHLTVFVSRTRGPFWSRPAPAWPLLGAVLGAQLVATWMVVSGFLMSPLPWLLVGLVWGWSLLWFLVEDRVKLVGYAWLDRAARAAAVPTADAVPPVAAA